MLLTVTVVLVLLALLFIAAHVAREVPLWPSVLVLCILELVQVLPLK